MSTDRMGAQKKILNKMKDSKSYHIPTPILGPEILKKATTDIQLVVKKILEDKPEISFSYNKEGDLIAAWSEASTMQSVNLSQALEAQPNFSHIKLTDSELNNYYNFLKNESKLPYDDKGKAKEPKYYIERELKSGIHSPLLNIAEKIAIHIYTAEGYVDINAFLRQYGKKSFLDPSASALTKDELQLKIKDLLCALVVAAHGLNKLESFNNPTFREDSFGVNPASLGYFAAKTKAQAERQPHRETAFYSSSDFTKKSSFEAPTSTYYAFYKIEGQSKPVQAYSMYPKEAEILYPPGTRFTLHAYQAIGDYHYFCLTEMKGIIHSDHKDNLEYETLTRFSAVSILDKEPRLEDMKPDIISMLEEDDQLTAYWIENGKIANKSFPVSGVQDIVSGLSSVDKSPDLMMAIISKYGCDSTPETSLADSAVDHHDSKAAASSNIIPEINEYKHIIILDKDEKIDLKKQGDTIILKQLNDSNKPLVAYWYKDKKIQRKCYLDKDTSDKLFLLLDNKKMINQDTDKALLDQIKTICNDAYEKNKIKTESLGSNKSALFNKSGKLGPAVYIMHPIPKKKNLL